MAEALAWESPLLCDEIHGSTSAPSLTRLPPQLERLQSDNEKIATSKIVWAPLTPQFKDNWLARRLYYACSYPGSKTGREGAFKAQSLYKRMPMHVYGKSHQRPISLSSSTTQSSVPPLSPLWVQASPQPPHSAVALSSPSLPAAHPSAAH